MKTFAIICACLASIAWVAADFHAILDVTNPPAYLRGLGAAICAGLAWFAWRLDRQAEPLR